MNQTETDIVWNSVWKKNIPENIRSIFSQRLFLEEYPVVKSFIPIGVRRILETGTGSGRYGAAFAGDFPSARIIATDIVPASLAVATLLKQGLGLENFSVERADVFALPYPDASFDVVFSDALLQHLADDQGAVSEMARVLEPGGILIFSSVNRYSPHGLFRFLTESFGRTYEYGFERLYTRAMLRALATKAHLEIVREDGFYPAYGIYRLKRYWSGFGSIGKALNRITHALDVITGRWVSRTFGFELVVVAKKP